MSAMAPPLAWACDAELEAAFAAAFPTHFAVMGFPVAKMAEASREANLTAFRDAFPKKRRVAPKRKYLDGNTKRKAMVKGLEVDSAKMQACMLVYSQCSSVRGLA